jgi:superfamily I DNA and/or RNA helicase
MHMTLLYIAQDVFMKLNTLRKAYDTLQEQLKDIRQQEEENAQENAQEDSDEEQEQENSEESSEEASAELLAGHFAPALSALLGACSEGAAAWTSEAQWLTILDEDTADSGITVVAKQEYRKLLTTCLDYANEATVSAVLAGFFLHMHAVTVVAVQLYCATPHTHCKSCVPLRHVYTYNA